MTAKGPLRAHPGPASSPYVPVCTASEQRLRRHLLPSTFMSSLTAVSCSRPDPTVIRPHFVDENLAERNTRKKSGGIWMKRNPGGPCLRLQYQPRWLSCHTAFTEGKYTGIFSHSQCRYKAFLEEMGHGTQWPKLTKRLRLSLVPLLKY